jgi:phospholipid/cholesterol/gamma-HCH transport system substrate-binding protein
MTARQVAGALLVTVAAAGTIAASPGGDDAYEVRLALDNAAGLRSGSDVTIGGVKAGTVSVRLDDGEKVIADLELDREHAPVGKDASAAITAVNFLGRKRVELEKGDVADPAPSGTVLKSGRVTVSTDLDQVLDVLDADTRARLTILINEAGGAMTGRRADVSELLHELPTSMASATRLLNRLVGDNQTLADLMTNSDRFVAQVAAERKSLARMVDVVGETATTVAARRSELRRTLAQTPRTLRTLQGFLGDLRATTVPLGPAARDITATAPRLSETLAQLDGFRRAAQPALDEATSVAPQLTRLGRRATPVVRRARPAVGALASFARALPPLTNALDHSTDNIFAVVENWARAIQLRDGLSHVFRGEASMTADALRSIVDRLTRTVTRKKTERRATERRTSRPIPAPAQSPATERRLPAVRVPDVRKTLDEVGKGVQGAVDGVQERVPDQGAGHLLDFLLGS